MPRGLRHGVRTRATVRKGYTPRTMGTREGDGSANAADIDLRDLRAFCQVVDRGSLTSAAKALGETKGAVSRRLTRLERALGVVLLRRSPRRVEATEDGAAYRARLGRALDLLDDAHAQAQ